MCKIRVGESVKTPQDIQNLITSTVVQQGAPFRKHDISVTVRKKLGKTTCISDERIESTIDRTIELLLASDCVSFGEGKYFIKTVSPCFSQYPAPSLA